MYELIEYFIIFSFLGWCLEVIYQATSKALIINRGFLNGPVCPIYGTGIVLLKIVLEDNIYPSWEIFLYGAVFSTLIELIGGYLLFKIFKCRWWDYSDKPFNFKGFICLEFSLIWGIGTVIVVKLMWPFIDKFNIDTQAYHILLIVILVMMTIDLIVSCIFLIGLHKKVDEVIELRNNLRYVSDELSTLLGTNALETKNKLEISRVQFELGKDEYEQELKIKLNNLEKYINKTKYFGAGRILDAFPHLKTIIKKEV